MELSALPEPIARLLRRADLAFLATDGTVTIEPSLDMTFTVSPSGTIILPPNCGLDARQGAVTVRHALELALFLRLWPSQPVLAGLAAARTAALFAILEEAPQMSRAASAPYLAPMAGPTALTAAQVRDIWPALARHQPGPPRPVDAQTMSALERIWPLLGPVEWLMQTGGDLRLVIDPVTGLNSYGCSHRPRPWAATFSSSTASSCSAQGYRGAERARRTILRSALESDAAVAVALERTRSAIRKAFAIQQDAVIALAPSGTDCELFALAAAQMHSSGRPVTNILVAPEETGSGVPLAAAGRHFAVDTARGAYVPRGELIMGFRDDTHVLSIPLREPDGRVRPESEIAADCERLVEAAVAAGRNVLLHRVDVSKTGLLAPHVDLIRTMQAHYPDHVDVVVDACQARLSPARVTQYLTFGWIVQLSGSKFVTGPPFSGAAVFPPTMLPRFHTKQLPNGLRDYSGRSEWPEGLPAASGLPVNGNGGLCLRWSAALAELEAFGTVPDEVKLGAITRFTTRVSEAISAQNNLHLVEVPALDRPGTTPAWDRLRTILSFAMRTGPSEPWLDMEAAKRVFTWLNADLSRALPNQVAERSLLHKRFHCGQPAKIALQGVEAGVLRISASARLISGEPSRGPMGQDERLDTAIADALALLDKVKLILRHVPELQATAPVATYI